MTSLRNKVIKLASENPGEIREALLPLLGRGVKSAQKNYSLGDFQNAAKDADQLITDAFVSASRLKAMWDTFEEIPTKQHALYDNNMKAISLLMKARDITYQNYMSLKRYR
jgi:hypothetical protein